MKGDSTHQQRLLLLASHIGFMALCVGFTAHAAQAQSSHHTQASVHMPQGSFLRRPSNNVSQLVNQVKSDNQVATRYARLFHLPMKLVPVAFNQLYVKQLTNDHIMQVHYVTDGEKLVYKPRRVKKGTYVYCLPDGSPLLIRVCGNPIRSRVSPELYTAAPVPDFNSGETLLPPGRITSPIVIGVPPSRTVVPPLTPVPIIPVVEAENVLLPTALPIAAPTLTPPQLKAISLPPVYSWVHGGGPGLAGLLPLALIPLISLGGSSGGASPLVAPISPTSPGGSTTTGGTPLVPPTTPVTPVVPITPITPTGEITPEPGTITLGLVLLFGTGFAAARKRRTQVI